MKSAAGTIGAAGVVSTAGAASVAGIGSTAETRGADIRSQFSRLEHEVYLNAGGMMPLGRFSIEGLRRYESFQELGGGDGRRDYERSVRGEIRGMFAQMIGAQERDIGLVHCTKAGEQIVLDGLREEFAQGKGIVTNDLHFAGALHNLVGLRETGVDLRIVRSRDWKIPVDEMVAAITDQTSLVTLSLVSNINGHIEDIRTIADAAHRHGALLFADIIQAVGISPIDVVEMGIDAAACSCYKWLYGVHGTGFLYVRHGLQGDRLPDRLFPGQGRHNYAPWTDEVDSDSPAILTQAREDATRYQPGHISYLGYCAAYEGMKFLAEIGVEAAQAHNTYLNQYLLEQLDSSRYTCITPDVTRSPIITFLAADADDARARLRASDVAVSFSANRIRVTPALFSNEGDMDRLAEVLN